VRNCSAYISVLILSMFTASAQENTETKNDQQKKELPRVITQIVVTDTKLEQPEANVTQKVNVVDTDEIERTITTNRNVSELLQYQPGVAITTLSRNDANWGSYGGLGPKYNSYLLDGLPIDAFVDTMSLDTWALQRIETHQGPASVLYSNYLSADFAGVQAPLAGITNLILKDRVEAPMTHAALGGGSWNTFNGRFYSQDRKGDLNYLFGASYEQSDYTNYGTPNSWLGMINDPSYKKVKFYGKVAYFLGREDHKLSVFFQHTLHDGFTGRPNRDFGNNYDTLNVAYSNQLNKRLNIQLKAGFRNYDRRWGDDNYPASLALVDHSGVKQRIVPADLIMSFKQRGDSIFTVGTDMQYATYQTYTDASTPRLIGNDASSRNNGFYAQEKLVVKQWVLRAGGRINRTADTYNLISGAKPGLGSRSWIKFLWSAGARYNLNKSFSVYTNAGNSFISPAAKSVGGTLLSTDRGVVGRNGQLPNPNLKPENGIGSDFGVEYTFAKHGAIGARGFYNKMSDVIVDNVVSNLPSQTQSVNAGDARSYGFETVYSQQITDQIKGIANFTRTVSRIGNPLDADQSGAAVSFVPDFVANVGIEISAPRGFKFSPYAHGVGSYYDSTSKSSRSKFGPYGALNVKLEKAIYQTDKYSAVMFTDLNNVTNRRYAMPWQFRDPGFNVLGGLDVRF
jgi:iron complex outermembrane receptor protein